MKVKLTNNNHQPGQNTTDVNDVDQISVGRAGCEDADKCCRCIPIKTGLCVLGGLAILNIFSMYIQEW